MVETTFEVPEDAPCREPRRMLTGLYGPATEPGRWVGQRVLVNTRSRVNWTRDTVECVMSWQYLH